MKPTAESLRQRLVGGGPNGLSRHGFKNLATDAIEYAKNLEAMLEHDRHCRDCGEGDCADCADCVELQRRAVIRLTPR